MQKKVNELNNKNDVIDNQTENDKKDANAKKNNSKGNVKQYGKYTVQSTFAGNSSITEIMNCYMERKASLKYY